MTDRNAAIQAESVIKLARGVRLRQDPVRQHMVLLAPERALALDEISVKIVEALDGKQSLNSIAENFAVQFSAPAAQILNDILAFAQELHERRLLEIVDHG